MSYNKLATHFKSRKPFKYNKEVYFNGTKIVATEKSWEYKDGRWQARHGTDEIVLAEYVEHNGKEYAVVYNRGNKCFTTEVMQWGFNNKWRSQKLQNLRVTTTTTRRIALWQQVSQSAGSSSIEPRSAP